MSQPNLPPTVEDDSKIKIFWPAFLSYCSKNPFLLLWNVALIIGGLIAFSYFVSIRYFPDMDVKTASSFLIGIALLGFLILAVIALTFVVPSYLIYSELWSKYWIYGPDIAGQQDQRVDVAIQKKRYAPFLTLSFLHGLGAFFFYFLCVTFFISDVFSSYKLALRLILSTGFCSVILMLFFWEKFWKWNDVRNHVVTVSEGRIKDSLKKQHFLFALIWWVFSLCYSFFISISMRNLKTDDVFGHFFIIFFIIFFVLANTVISFFDFRSGKDYWKVIFVSATATTLFLSIPSNPLIITRGVFSSLAIGDLGASKLIVKREACDAVNFIVHDACEIASDTVGCIRPKRLASRIGNEYLLILDISKYSNSAEGKLDGNFNTEVKIPIQKSEVLAWGILDSNDSRWASCVSKNVLQN